MFHSLSGAMGTRVCRKHNVQPGNGGTEPKTRGKPLRHESACTYLRSWLGWSAGGKAAVDLKVRQGADLGQEG